MRIEATSSDGQDQGWHLIDPNACATISLAEAARVLGVHRSTAWELHKRGEFPVPVLQIGHRLRVTKRHLQRYLDGPPLEPDLGRGPSSDVSR
jgi:excisionase family DNA binding protein